MQLYNPFVVDPTGFDPPSPILLPILACFTVLWLLRRYGKMITPADGATTDLLIDLATLLSAGGIVLSLNATPFGKGLSDSINAHVSGSKDSPMRLSGVSLSVGVVLLAILALIGWLYIKSEDGKMLILFGFGIFAAASFSSPLKSVLDWVVDPGMQTVWNGLMGALKLPLSWQVRF